MALPKGGRGKKEEEEEEEEEGRGGRMVVIGRRPRRACRATEGKGGLMERSELH